MIEISVNSLVRGWSRNCPRFENDTLLKNYLCLKSSCNSNGVDFSGARADDVPARLSKNEFVMTADAVRAAGGGSVNKGAKRMYDLMNNLEARV